jgi:hypothetical protein
MENTVDYDDFRGECMLKRLLIDHCAWTMNTDWVMSGGLAADARFPSVVVDAIVERILDYKRANVTLEQEPPFSRLDWRKELLNIHPPLRLELDLEMGNGFLILWVSFQSAFSMSRRRPFHFIGIERCRCVK